VKSQLQVRFWYVWRTGAVRRLYGLCSAVLGVPTGYQDHSICNFAKQAVRTPFGDRFETTRYARW
jgi:hypothetical protein